MLRHATPLAAVASLALVATGYLASGPTLAAPASATYRSAAFRYAFRYPATWSTFRGQGIDMAVTAPGRHAGFAAIVKPGSESAAVLKADLMSLLASVGTLTSTPAYGVRTINGVTYQSWSATTGSHTKTETSVTFGAVHGKYMYFFAAGVETGVPSSNANAQAMNALVSTLKLS
jgi:hypothetical protein